MNEDQIGAWKQRVVSVGTSGNHWYAVERSAAVPPGKMTRTSFWGTDIALFRTPAGALGAVEDRCAHRHLPFSALGAVGPDGITCGYHGWRYDRSGRCVHIPLSPVSEDVCSRVAIRSFPVHERYGLIWLFPGDPEAVSSVAPPRVATLETGKPVPYTILDETFDAHYSMVIENFCDLYHEHLHAKYQPFSGSKLVSATPTERGFDFVYDTAFARGLVLKYFLEGFETQTRVRLSYVYPHLSLDFGGRQELWIFLLPSEPSRTRVFAFFLPRFLIPFTRRPMPYSGGKVLTQLFTALYARTFTREDRVVLRLEQDRVRHHGGKPSFEVNPVVGPLRQLLVDRWESYRESEQRRSAKAKSRHEALVTLGGGLRFDELEVGGAQAQPLAVTSRGG